MNDQHELVISLKKKRWRVQDIAKQTGLSFFRIASIWRSYKNEALGIQDNLETEVATMSQEGLSAIEIAAQLGWSVSQIRLIRYRLRVSGILPRKEHAFRPPERRRTEISARDYEIWRLIRAKTNAAQLAASHGLTRARIYQIVADVSARIRFLRTKSEDERTDMQNNVLKASETSLPLEEL